MRSFVNCTLQNILLWWLKLKRMLGNWRTKQKIKEEQNNEMSIEEKRKAGVGKIRKESIKRL